MGQTASPASPTRSAKSIPIRTAGYATDSQGPSLGSPAEQSPSITDPIEGLTLDAALRMTDRFHPALVAAAATIEAMHGRHDQAGRYPNPSLALGTESAPFNGGPGRGEDFVNMSQPIIVGNRRQAALTEADRRIEAAEQAYDLARRQRHQEVRTVFYSMLFAQQGVTLAERQVTNQEELVRATRLLREQKEASQRDELQAEVDLANVRVRAAGWEKRLQVARAGLARVIGQPTLNVTSCAGLLELPPPLPPYEVLDSRLQAAHPELAVADREVAVQEAGVARARADRVPDVTVGFGYRYLGDEHVNAYDLQVSVPIPIFDRNQGRIREAQANASRAAAERETTRTSLVGRLRATHSDYTLSREQAARYRDEILPKSAKSVEMTRRGYQAGEISLLVLLDAQRTANEAELAYLQVLLDAIQAAAEIEYLVPD